MTLMRLHNWNCDALMVRKWLNESGENFFNGWRSWVSRTTTAAPRPPTREHRKTTHRFGDWDGAKWVFKHQGPILVKFLKEACVRYGVEIMTQARGRHLLQDEDGSVNGVVVEGLDGLLTVRARAVILATGSISNNQQLIRRFYGSRKA